MRSLIDQEKNIFVLPFNEGTIPQRANNSPESTDFKYNFGTQELILPAQRIVVTNDQLAQNYGLTISKKDKTRFKYLLKVQEVLSDSINHYFVKQEDNHSLISVFPCSKFTIIEYNTEQHFTDQLPDEEISFLENQLGESLQDIELIDIKENSCEINYEKSQSVQLIPDSSTFSYPFISSLFTSLVAIFTFSANIDNSGSSTYEKWLIGEAKKISDLNSLLFRVDDTYSLHKFGKLFHGKDINYINIISNLIINLKFKFTFTNKNLTSLTYQNIINILNHFYAI